ncbi:MAG: hypothetical protein ACR2IV_09525 [Bryobacteraceae bacterium]
MPKRTRKESQDINQFAASIVRQVTEVPVDLNDKTTVSQIMREMGRRGGIKGAATLNGSLTAKQRTLSAQKAARARWAKRAKKTS